MRAGNFGRGYGKPEHVVSVEELRELRAQCVTSKRLLRSKAGGVLLVEMASKCPGWGTVTSQAP